MNAEQLLSMSVGEVWRQHKHELPAVRQALYDYMDTVPWGSIDYFKCRQLSIDLHDCAIDAKHVKRGD